MLVAETPDAESAPEFDSELELELPEAAVGRACSESLAACAPEPDSELEDSPLAPAVGRDFRDSDAVASPGSAWRAPVALIAPVASAFPALGRA